VGRRPWAIVGPVLVSVGLTLAALEGGARLLADPTGGYRELLDQRVQARASSVHVGSDDPELVYVNRPGYVTNGVRITEAHGIVRETDVTPARPGGTFRIAVLGDSIAAAHPVRVGGEPSFSDELERLLNEREGSRHYEVLNFGTDGYGTVQEARLLETRAGTFDPDVVLVQYCLNDPATSYTPTVWFLEGKDPKSSLLDLVRRRLGYTPSEIHPAHPRYTHGSIEWRRLYARDGEAWRQVQRGFVRIEAWARTRNIPVALALFPLLHDGREPESERVLMEEIYTQVRNAAAARGFRVVDLAPVFAANDPGRLRLLPEDPIHPGALGHRLAAQAIATALDLVPPAPGPDPVTGR
jgi:lysophospholipase L1-like esterase